MDRKSAERQPGPGAQGKNILLSDNQTSREYGSKGVNKAHFFEEFAALSLRSELLGSYS